MLSTVATTAADASPLCATTLIGTAFGPLPFQIIDRESIGFASLHTNAAGGGGAMVTIAIDSASHIPPPWEAVTVTVLVVSSRTRAVLKIVTLSPPGMVKPPPASSP